MTKDRLSPLDASFLRLEDATSHMHMHMAAALIFAGKSPSYGRLLAANDRLWSGLRPEGLAAI